MSRVIYDKIPYIQYFAYFIFSHSNLVLRRGRSLLQGTEDLFWITIMRLYLPIKTLTTGDILDINNVLQIPNFKGVMMRDELSSKAKGTECGIVNLNTSKESGTHWVCYYKMGHKRYYFDSFAEPPPLEIEKYLKSKRELGNDLPCIIRNFHTVQHDNATECGGLCLYVLKALSKGVPFSAIMQHLRRRYCSSRPNSPLFVEVHNP